MLVWRWSYAVTAPWFGGAVFLALLALFVPRSEYRVLV